MAKDKTSFIAYSEWNTTFKKLTDEEAGRLAKMIFSYVSDENPTAPDRITDLLFEPIKNNLKRDLRKYESIRKNRIEAGRIGGLKSGKVRSKALRNEANEALASNALKNEANEAVNVNVNVNGNVNKEEYICKIQEKFYQSLTPFLDKFDKQEIRKFYDYWSEPNKSKTKIKWQLEKTWDTNKRLIRWTNNKFNEKIRTNNNKGFESDTTRGAIESVKRIFEQNS